MQSGDLHDVGVRGHHAAAEPAGHRHDPRVRGHGVVILVARSEDVDVDPGVGPHAREHVEPAPGPGPQRPVGRVGRGLEFVEHERRDHEPALEQARLGEVGDPSVDDRGGIEDVGAEPTDVPGELDVGNEEAEVVAGLEEQARAEVAQNGAEDDGQPRPDRAVAVGREDRRQRQHRDVGQEHAHEEAEVDGGDRGQVLALDAGIDPHHRQRQRDHRRQHAPRQPLGGMPHGVGAEDRHGDPDRDHHEQGAQDDKGHGIDSRL